MDKENSIALQIQTLPAMPGVYQFFDKEGKLLYVGKAKNLKKRVASYFNKTHDTARLKVLVKKIHEIKHIVVNSEMDALLLENSLIKKNQPRYNIMLKDDKTYPWLVIKNERFPRVFSTRRVIKDGSEYFGPYTFQKTRFALLDLIKELYPLRTCSYDLSKEKIENHKYKVCLEYHIGNCLGPCEGLETAEEYADKISDIRQILKGDLKQSKASLHQKMMKYAENLNFEEAQNIKNKLEALENYQAKSTIVSTRITDVLVFGIISDVKSAFVNMLQIQNGTIVGSQTMQIKKKLEESDEEILPFAIIDFIQKYRLKTTHLIVPFPVDLGDDYTITVPKLGEKKKLLDLSVRNAKFYRVDQMKKIKIRDPEAHTNRLMEQMKKDLRMPVQPRHIECFDNSNIQGTNPVAACVVFKNGVPSKKDYRKFAIKTVEGPDDFASMEEVVYRRYKRLLEEEEPLPDLIVIDGGKGQLGAALKSLERLGLRGKITILGIAKRLEELFFPGDPHPLYLDKKSETLKVIQQARNEAHRFGITFHRAKRSKAAIHSELLEIDGVGHKTMEKLMKRFKSIKRMKEATIEQLTEEVGPSKAKIINQHFNSIDETK